MKYCIKKSIGLALAAVGFVFAQNAPQWQNLYPAYSGLAFGADKFVAVSSDGLIRTTGDGAAWSQPYRNNEGWNSRRIYTVAYGADRFVALQNRFPFLHSADGLSWGESVTSLPVSVWKHITFGEVDGEWGFVAVDDEGWTALYDDDSWKAVDAGVNSLSHAAYGAGIFVVVGDGIKSSADAKGWGLSKVSAQVSVVAFGGGKFAALARSGGAVYTSPDGISWANASASGVPAEMADMVFDNGKFVAVGSAGKGCWSSDGASWTGFTLNDADDFNAVKYGNNTFLALGAKGSVYKSSDGSSWTRLAGNSVTSYKQIVYGASKYVAVGDSGVSVSSDGKDWVRKESAKNLVGVAFGDGKFVAVGSNGTIISSTNGDTWEAYNADNTVFTSVAFGGGIFVVGGRTEGIAQTSKPVVYILNGQNWADVSNDLTGWGTGQYPVSLCFGKDQFLAAVSGSKAMKTCDATANGVKYWSSVTGLPNEADGYSMVSAVYVGDKFVVVGNNQLANAVVFYSSDAANWMATQEIKGVRAATYAQGYYVAAADSGNVYAYIGNKWEIQRKATTRNLSTIYAANDAIIAAGAGGVILYSTETPVSVRYASASRNAASPVGAVMTLDRSRRAPAVTLSFTPKSAGTIAVYSLSGRMIYRARLDAGERIARLPERVMSSGSVVVRYSGGGKVVNQRFQFVR